MHLFDFSSLCICKCLLKLPTWKDAKPHWLHLFDYFSTMHFQMCFQSAFIRVCIGLSPLCVFKCLLKSFACKDAKSHWLHLFLLFTSVCFQMCLQIACLGGCILTLVREPVKKKLRDYLGVFPKCRTPSPPRPPIWEASVQKIQKIQKNQKIQKKLKHVLALQNDFGMPKNYLVKSQKFWD